MRPPLAGKRPAARRLVARLRRALAPVERVLPVRPGGFAAGAGTAPGPAVGERKPEPIAGGLGGSPPPRDTKPAPPAPADAAARIDAARERLRATIEPPRDED